MELPRNARNHSARSFSADFESLDLSAALRSTAYDVVIFADVLEHLRPSPCAGKSSWSPRQGRLCSGVDSEHHTCCRGDGNGQGQIRVSKIGLLDDTRSVFRLFEEAGFSIVGVDRVARSPDATEFDIDMTAPDNRTLLSRQQNPEFNPYQFIIKAVPRNAEQLVAGREDHDLYSKLSALEDALQTRDAKLRLAESKLRRIEGTRAYCLLAKVQESHAHLALTCGNSSGGENSAGGMRGGLQPTWC